MSAQAEFNQLVVTEARKLVVAAGLDDMNILSAMRVLVARYEREQHARSVFESEGLDPDRVRDVFASQSTSENQ